jgi:DNA repair protein SbcC/Rad50
LAARQKQQAELEAALRWHQVLAGMETAIAEAQTTLEQAQQAHRAADDRRAHLARVGALEPARPLHAECVRLSEATQQTLVELQTLEATLITAEQARSQAETALVQARHHHDAALKAQRDRQPDIDAAKRLDVEIALLAQQCRNADNTLASESQALSAQRSAHAALTEQHALTAKAQAETASWLAAHTGHAVLAGQWNHVEYLLLAAEKAAAARHIAEAATLRLQQDEARAGEAASQHAASLETCALARKQAEAAAQSAGEKCARFNPDALAEQKAEAENLRLRLHSAQAGWTQWQERQRELAATEQEADALRQARQGSETALQALSRQRPGLEGQLQQAERALQRLQTACNRDLDALRASLRQDEACPVCGASEHPYADAGAVHALHELLKTQQGEHDALRRVLDDVVKEETRHAATLQAQDRQLAALAGRLQELTRRRDEAAGNWQTARQPLDLPVPAAEEIAPWLAGRIGANTAALLSLNQQEAELRATRRRAMRRWLR